MNRFGIFRLTIPFAIGWYIKYKENWRRVTVKLGLLWGTRETFTRYKVFFSALPDFIVRPLPRHAKDFSRRFDAIQKIPAYKWNFVPHTSSLASSLTSSALIRNYPSYLDSFQHGLSSPIHPWDWRVSDSTHFFLSLWIVSGVLYIISVAVRTHAAKEHTPEHTRS